MAVFTFLLQLASASEVDARGEALTREFLAKIPPGRSSEPEVFSAAPDPALRLVFVGDRYRDELTALARRLELSSTVVWSGIPLDAVAGRASVQRALELTPGFVRGRRMDRPVQLIVDGAPLRSMLD